MHKTKPAYSQRRTTASFLSLALATIAPTTWAQTTASPPPPNQPPTAQEEVIELSPFQVEASSDDVGYYASQSLSGTRLNSKLEDLAASITVVTKQQLVDTAAVDINDIFLYESNTEGMHQYTDFVQDRSFYNEVTTLNPQSANRVRGVSAVNMARGNFAASSTIPVDTYNIDAVEISRGPNANIFGLGDAAGTVNLITMSGNTTQDITQTTVRGDSSGGFRATLDVNRPLIKDVLGLRVATVHDDKGFERKPSYEKISRTTVALQFKPFKTTTLRASYESYYNEFNRGNTTLPRDVYSEWMATGMPVWNPTFGTTGGWRYLNETTYRPVAANNETRSPTEATNPGLPVGLYPNFNTFWARPSAYVDDGSIQRLEMARVANAPTTGLPAPGFNNNYRYSETGSIYRRGGNAFGVAPLILFQIPSVSDKSHYDYTSINFLAPNYGRDKADIKQVELEQWIINSRKHQLALQLGFFEEDINRFDHSFLSRTDGATPLVSVDVNEFYIDGTPNPYFLRPYIFASEPRVNMVDELNEAHRATLAYQIDFTRNDGWSKLFGRHRFAGYGEFREQFRRSTGAREKIVNDFPWTSANDLISIPNRGATYNLGMRYYVGGPVTDPGPIIDYAPSAPDNIPGSLPFIWYGSGSRTPIIEQAELDASIFTGQTRWNQIRTVGAIWQGFLWEDRIVPNIGWRKDRQRETLSRSLNVGATSPTNTLDPVTRQADLSVLDEFPNAWIENQGTTRTKGIVVKPLSWLNLHYNESDSFLPEAIRWNIFLEQLPNPTGVGKDYGISFDLLDGKLVGRINKYKTVQDNSRSGSTGGAFAQRTFRFFFDTGSAGLTFNETNQTFANGLDPFDLEQVGAQWFRSTRAGLTPEQARLMSVETYVEPFGFDQAYMDRVRELGGGSFAEVNTVTSEGIEFELNYNPTRNWTLKVTAARQEAIDSNLSTNLSGFFEENFDALNEITIPTDPVVDANGAPVLDVNGNPTFLPGAGTPWWTYPFASGSTGSAETWYFVNIQTTLKQASVNAGKPRPQTREWRFAATTNYRLAGITDNKWLKNVSIGGALRWEDKAVVGYFGAAPLANGAIVDLDPNRPIHDKARTYVDFLATYDTRLFNDKVKCRLQLNVRNAFESGRLQAFVHNPDGQAWNYRIIDPRQFILTATFDL